MLLLTLFRMLGRLSAPVPSSQHVPSANCWTLLFSPIRGLVQARGVCVPGIVRPQLLVT